MRAASDTAIKAHEYSRISRNFPEECRRSSPRRCANRILRRDCTYPSPPRQLRKLIRVRITSIGRIGNAISAVSRIRRRSVRAADRPADFIILRFRVNPPAPQFRPLTLLYRSIFRSSFSRLAIMLLANRLNDYSYISSIIIV